MEVSSARGKVGKSEEGENGVLVRHWGWARFFLWGGKWEGPSFQQLVAVRPRVKWLNPVSQSVRQSYLGPQIGRQSDLFVSEGQRLSTQVSGRYQFSLVADG